MALNARRHTIPAGTDQTINRATIFETFGQSVHDVVPVASATDQDLLVSDMQAASVGPSTSNPLVTVRADAPGLHRIELTTDGTTWVPASGVLHFVDDTAKDTFTASNPGLFSIGDRCFAGGIEYRWNGTWVRFDTGWLNVTLDSAYTYQNRTPQVRRVGSVVYYRGDVKPKTGTFAASAVITVGTAGVPLEARPTGVENRQLAGNSAGVDVRGYVASSGDVVVVTGPSVPVYADLGGLSGYTVD